MYIYIRSMSDTQSEIRRKLSANNTELVKHIMKLLMYPHVTTHHHWKSEIYGFVNTCPKMKRGNKRPKPAFIKHCISTMNDSVAELVKQIVSENKEFYPADVPVEVMEDAVEEYTDWLATKLSLEGVVTIDEVDDKLATICKSAYDKY